ncbi:hypothetical protein WJX74_009122 [Apatococcus lobatus]|uniref:DUF559 domain-containing protein n=1 Tax=Apatococcus lobatus TaxID=904363 RepID=A0AAW1RBQ7_9CHLO
MPDPQPLAARLHARFSPAFPCRVPDAPVTMTACCYTPRAPNVCESAGRLLHKLYLIYWARRGVRVVLFKFALQPFLCGLGTVDLYLSKPKIAVECDEHGHSAYNQLQERQRQTFIEEQLGCTFVRFNPYAQGFSIGDPIAAIVDKLMN